MNINALNVENFTNELYKTDNLLGLIEAYTYIASTQDDTFQFDLMESIQEAYVFLLNDLGLDDE